MHRYGNRRICRSFSEQAKATWGRLEKEILTNIQIGEESLTDFNLQDIQIKNPLQVKTQKINRHEEARNGADWEWWLCSKNVGFGLRVQAKKLDLSKNIYPGVDKTTKYGRQIDLLIENALANYPPLFPIYVFYNYFNPKSINFTKSTSFLRNPKQLGCSIVPAQIVRDKFIEKQFGMEDIKNIIMPWHCLVCKNCKTGKRKKNLSLPERASKLLYQKIRKSKSKEIYKKCEKLISKESPDNILSEISEVLPNGERFISQELPDYVTKVLDGKILNENDWGKLGVNGIMVINEL